jgi:uncharacterized protein YacL
VEIIIQIVLVTVTAVTGFFIAREIFESPLLGWIGSLFGLGIGYVILKFEERLKTIPLKTIFGSLIGVTVSLIVTNLFISRLLLNMVDVNLSLPIYILLYFIAGYLGFRIGSNKGQGIDLSKLPMFRKAEEGDNLKVLDTSAVIDGRIADIAETGFVEGTLIIPQFVLYEIQHIADQQDPLKKTRGRRGLDVLNRLRKQSFVKVKIVDYDFQRFKDVDSKLVALAKKLDGSILTNDFNLHKVAELQGIKVLNINQLATSLKPNVLPGEPMAVKVLKEGKEQKQGIGYLDDGTMVVVDEGRKLLGRQVDVVVTSVLQTTSGRMIFARLREPGDGDLYESGAGGDGESGAMT